MLTIIICVIGVVISYYYLVFHQDLSRDMEWSSFLIAKSAIFYNPLRSPENTSSLIISERESREFTLSLFRPIDLYFSPELKKIQKIQISIPVTPTIDKFTNKTVSSISAFIYSNVNDIESSLKLPVILWFHGGGWVRGSASGDHTIAAKLALHSNFLIVNVDYRLAPNFIFPTAINDAFESLQWVGEHIHEYGGDATQITIGGESSGGNLAAALISRWLDEKHQLHLEDKHSSETDSNKVYRKESPRNVEMNVIASLLVYPPLDTITNSTAAEIYDQTNGLLRLSNMEWFRQLYQGEEGYNPTIREHFWFSPLLTPSHLIADYPPSIFILAKYDILTEENVRFAELLQSHGRIVRMRIYSSTIHGFYGKPILSMKGDEAVIQSCQDLKDLTSSTSYYTL